MNWTETLVGEPRQRGYPVTDRAAITDLLCGCSVGTLSAIVPEASDGRDLLPPETRVHVAANRPLRATLAAARTLRNEGFEPVVDIVARRFGGPAHFADYLTRLRGAADVREVVIIDAGVGGAMGSLPTVLDWHWSGVFDRAGIARVGLAADPAAHGASDPFHWRRAIVRCNAGSIRADARLHFVTRPGFDAERVLAWEAAAQAADNRLPVHVGLPGPATPGPLPGLERLCGLAPSSGDDADSGLDAMLRVSLSAPNRMVTRLARHRRAHPGSAIRGVHILAPDGLSGTALWLDAVLRGAFTIHEDGTGLAVGYHAAA